ncbi:hypothetical protein QBC39DRAFT_363881 [Podospora conica]|nr:hypothetical protein QBC39DRAFT_363881 [Schizothecium conicum]
MAPLPRPRPGCILVVIGIPIASTLPCQGFLASQEARPVAVHKDVPGARHDRRSSATREESARETLCGREPMLGEDGTAPFPTPRRRRNVNENAGQTYPFPPNQTAHLRAPGV